MKDTNDNLNRAHLSFGHMCLFTLLISLLEFEIEITI